MAVRTSTIEDLETGQDKEFERIKQNFTTTSNRDHIANLAEIQASFQELQTELQEFLAQHVQKTSSLQERIVAGVSVSNDDFDTQRTIMPVLSPRASQMSNGDSHQAIEDNNPNLVPPKSVVISPDKAFVDVHMRNLQAFLVMHAENIRRLQDSPHSPIPLKEPTAAPNNATRTDTQAQDLHMVANVNIAVSIFMATLIVIFLLLVVVIIGSRHRTPYSVSMFFALLALAALLISIVTARLTLPTSTQDKPSSENVNFHVQICENLQLIAAALFMVSIIIAMYVIFVSLAFPFVALFLSGVAALMVFMSVHWEVAITFGNILYLTKNIRRLGTVVDFVKYHRKTPTPADFF